MQKNDENVCVCCSNHKVTIPEGQIGIPHVQAYPRVCFYVVTCQVWNRCHFYLPTDSSESYTFCINPDTELPAIQDC